MNRLFFWILLILGGSLSLVGYKKFIAPPLSENVRLDIKVVEVENVKLKDIQQTVRLIGTIKPKNATLLIAKASGVLDSLLPAGQHVQKGTLIAKIDNIALERNYQLAQSAEKLARESYDRALLLHQSGHFSKSLLEEKRRLWLEAQRKRSDAEIELDKIRIYAPFEGIIGLFKSPEGTQVQPGDPLVSFYDPTSLKVEFGIPAPIVPFIQEGQLLFLQGIPYNLSKLQRMIDEETHMAPAYVDFKGDNCVIGTDIDVDLVIQKKENVIVIPVEAVFLRQGKTVVYCVQNNQAILVPVEVGIRQKKEVEILSGLKEGDSLIVRGQARLHPNAEVKIQIINSP